MTNSVPNSVWTMESANLYVGSATLDTNASNHLTLSEVKLPALDVQYVDHRAGGAPIAIEIDTVIARLECAFTLVGVTPQVMTKLGSWVQSQNDFYIYGVIRDQQTGSAAQAAAYIQGQLSRVDPQNYRRGDVLHTVYGIRGIIHYELNIAGEQIYFWDFATNTRIIGTNDQNALTNQFLKVPNATANPVLGTVADFTSEVDYGSSS